MNGTIRHRAHGLQHSGDFPVFKLHQSPKYERHNPIECVMRQESLIARSCVWARLMEIHKIVTEFYFGLY